MKKESLIEMLKDITKSRLNLIIAKAQLLLATNNPWYQDASAAISEISKEAQKAENEIRHDASWQNGDR